LGNGGESIDLISLIDDDENALPLHQEYKIYTKKKKISYRGI